MSVFLYGSEQMEGTIEECTRVEMPIQNKKYEFSLDLVHYGTDRVQWII